MSSSASDNYDSDGAAAFSAEEHSDEERELSELTFEERLQFNNATKKQKTIPETNDRKHVERQQRDANSFKRENKNRPQEISSKKAVSRKRIVVELPHKEKRVDPRFDPMCGTFHKDMYEKAYSFIDDYKDKEMKDLKKQIERSKNPEKIAALRQEYDRLKQKRIQESRKKQSEEVKRQWKKEEQEKVKDGKRPYFPKKSDFKRMELEKVYEKAKESGTVDKLMARKRKRTEKKEKKKLPFRVERR
jgi:ribosomal RNA-processing protein 36